MRRGLGAKRLEGQAILSDNRAVALVREGRMLGKQSTTTESAPVWRFLRFFGLDNRRDKESPTADKRPPREPRTESISSPSGMFSPRSSAYIDPVPTGSVHAN